MNCSKFFGARPKSLVAAFASFFIVRDPLRHDSADLSAMDDNLTLRYRITSEYCSKNYDTYRSLCIFWRGVRIRHSLLLTRSSLFHWKFLSIVHFQKKRLKMNAEFEIFAPKYTENDSIFLLNVEIWGNI